MIPLKEQFTIAAPPEAVWPLLSDPVRVAACLPGAAITADKGNGAYEGTMRVKFGPTIVNFRGELTLVYDHAARRCEISGRGIDQRGASRALASGKVEVTGVDSSVVNVEGAYHVTGPLEMFAKSGGVHLARTLMSEFAQNIAGVLQNASAAPASDTGQAAPAPVARELSAATLIWRTLASFIRRLFQRT